jgi:CheY-like chemotaxis protein
MVQHSPTILVVDDDEDIRAFLTDLLTGVGYGVDSVPDGGLALEKLQAAPTRFSLVLLDLMMPLIDGYVFRERQRADPAIADIPVVTLSASAIVRQRGLPVGIEPTNFLTKPPDIDALLSIIHLHCGPPLP